MANHGEPWLHVVPFVLLTLLFLALPALCVLALGQRAKSGLPKVRDWMDENYWIVSEIVAAFFIRIVLFGERGPHEPRVLAGTVTAPGEPRSPRVLASGSQLWRGASRLGTWPRHGSLARGDRHLRKGFAVEAPRRARGLSESPRIPDGGGCPDRVFAACR